VMKMAEIDRVKYICHNSSYNKTSMVWIFSRNYLVLVSCLQVELFNWQEESSVYFVATSYRKWRQYFILVNEYNRFSSPSTWLTGPWDVIFFCLQVS
jgi:hypothetical protein